MLRKALLTLGIGLLMLPLAALGQVSEAGKPVKTVNDRDYTGTWTWTRDTVWVLDGRVWVQDGEQLTIEAGTVIKGAPGTDVNASALIVSPGGKIFAVGTPTQPIVFTAEIDNVDDPNDLGISLADRGLWGSLIILGRATVRTASGTANIEGIPITEPRGIYGGTNDNDNSGILRYVSLRHGGSVIGEGNEINGLTLGGVGRGTTIEYVECFQNLDDGVECFGGTVNLRNMAVFNCDDDGYDFDYGYSGSLQNIFAIKSQDIPSSGSHGFEWDYCTPGGCIAPLNFATVSNATILGVGASASATVKGRNPYAFSWRTGAGGYIYNSLFGEHGQKVVQLTTATSVDYLLQCCVGPRRGDMAPPPIGDGVDGDGSDLQALVDFIFFADGSQLQNCFEEKDVNADVTIDGGDLGAVVDFLFFGLVDQFQPCPPAKARINGNIFWDFGSGAAWNLLVATGSSYRLAEVEAYMAAYNTIANPVLNGTSRIQNGGLDPRPSAGGPAASGVVAVNDPNSYIDESVTYRGAFDPNATELWICGWTAMDHYGMLPCAPTCSGCATDLDKPTKNLVDADINTGGYKYLRKDTVWILQDKVFVESGAKLVIEPGTIIKGAAGTDVNAKALIISVGGQIFAPGTQRCPIIFTAEADNVWDPNDLGATLADRGLWGSLIVLGDATVRTATGTARIEGIPIAEPRGSYGGTDDADNSGVITYVSLRHGGAVIGEGNEINGLTCGGVGTGTTIHHVETYQNLDDSFEFFGGTVSASHLVGTYCDDDNLDTDFGYNGAIQFFFSLKADDIPSSGSHGFELDYCTPGGCVAQLPLNEVTVSNATVLGVGSGASATVQGRNPHGVSLRTGASPKIWNSFFGEHKRFVQFATTASENYYLTPGDTLLIRSNIVSDMFDEIPNSNWTNVVTASAGNIAAITAQLSGGTDLNAFGASGQLFNTNRQKLGLLDPRPAGGSALNAGFVSTGDSRINNSLSYRGAFDPTKPLSDSWIAGWTALWCTGHTSTL